MRDLDTFTLEFEDIVLIETSGTDYLVMQRRFIAEDLNSQSHPSENIRTFCVCFVIYNLFSVFVCNLFVVCEAFAGVNTYFNSV
jgi:hypothetical protein